MSSVWQEVTDESGQVYYYNQETGESSWEDPRPASKRETKRGRGAGRRGNDGGIKKRMRVMEVKLNEKIKQCTDLLKEKRSLNSTLEAVRKEAEETKRKLTEDIASRDATLQRKAEERVSLVKAQQEELNRRDEAMAETKADFARQRSDLERVIEDMRNDTAVSRLEQSLKERAEEIDTLTSKLNARTQERDDLRKTLEQARDDAKTTKDSLEKDVATLRGELSVEREHGKVLRRNHDTDLVRVAEMWSVRTSCPLPPFLASLCPKWEEARETAARALDAACAASEASAASAGSVAAAVSAVATRAALDACDRVRASLKEWDLSERETEEEEEGSGIKNIPAEEKEMGKTAPTPSSRIDEINAADLFARSETRRSELVDRIKFCSDELEFRDSETARAKEIRRAIAYDEGGDDTLHEGGAEAMVRLLDADAPRMGRWSVSSELYDAEVVRARDLAEIAKRASDRRENTLCEQIANLNRAVRKFDDVAATLERRTMRLEERRRRCIDQVRAACGSAHFTHLQLRVAADARSIDSELRRVTKHRREATAEQLRARRGLSRGVADTVEAAVRADLGRYDLWTSHLLALREARGPSYADAPETDERRTTLEYHAKTIREDLKRIEAEQNGRAEWMRQQEEEEAAVKKRSRKNDDVETEAARREKMERVTRATQCAAIEIVRLQHQLDVCESALEKKTDDTTSTKRSASSDGDDAEETWRLLRSSAFAAMNAVVAGGVVPTSSPISQLVSSVERWHARFDDVARAQNVERLRQDAKRDVERAHSDLDAQERRRRRDLLVRDRQINAVRAASLDAMKLLKLKIAKTAETWRRRMEERVAVEEAKRREVEARAAKLEEDLSRCRETSKRRLGWVDGLKLEVARAAADARERERAFEAAERRRAQVAADLRRELRSALTAAERRHAWIRALEAHVQRLRDDLKKSVKARDALEARLSAKIARLRRERATREAVVRAVMTRPKLLFSFFAEAVETLAGSSRSMNDELRAGGAPEMLLALCSSNVRVVARHAASALGRLCWDGRRSDRSLRALATMNWRRTRDVVSSLLRDARVEWARKLNEDVEDVEDALEDVEARRERIALLLLRRSGRSVRKPMTSGSVNRDSQRAVARMGERLLVSMRQLLSLPDVSLRRSATSALAVASLDTSQRDRMLGDVALVERLALLCASEQETTEIYGNLAATMGNLAHESEAGRDTLGAAGCVQSLTKLLLRTEEIVVAEAAAKALTTLMAGAHEGNARRFFTSNGVRAAHAHASASQRETQAAAASALENATACANLPEAPAAIRALGVRPLVLLCASPHADVRLPAARVLGNLGRVDALRESVVRAQGVEALALLISSDDEGEDIVASALWALSNLAWCTIAQDRIGRYTGTLVRLTVDVSRADRIRTNAAAALANTLFFHEVNRRRVGRCYADGSEDLAPKDGGGDGLPSLVRTLGRRTSSPKYLEHVCRALGTAAHNDANAATIVACDGISLLVTLLKHNSDHSDLRRYAAFALSNIAIHDAHRSAVLRASDVVPALVESCASSDDGVRRQAAHALRTLGHTSIPKEKMDAYRETYGFGGVVELLKDDANPVLQGTAAETIAHETFMDPATQTKIERAEGGIAAIVKLVDSENKRTALRALWALRNAVHEHPANKAEAVACGCVRSAVARMSAAADDDEDADLREAALACLVNLTIGDPRSARYVIAHGLDAVIQLAEKGVELALDLLQIVGPYKYILCTKCGERNQSGKEVREMRRAHRVSRGG